MVATTVHDRHASPVGPILHKDFNTCGKAAPTLDKKEGWDGTR
jgi:hypothetical protein